MFRYCMTPTINRPTRVTANIPAAANKNYRKISENAQVEKPV